MTQSYNWMDLTISKTPQKPRGPVSPEPCWDFVAIIQPHFSQVLVIRNF